jgi:hypothetical protein
MPAETQIPIVRPLSDLPTALGFRHRLREKGKDPMALTPAQASMSRFGGFVLLAA